MPASRPKEWPLGWEAPGQGEGAKSYPGPSQPGHEGHPWVRELPPRQALVVTPG